MLTLVATLHVIIALLLIVFVLMQDSKGGAAGGMFAGGGSHSILGATGATNLLVKVTRVLAIGFAISCVALTVMTIRQSKSVLEGVALPAAAPVGPISGTPAAEPVPAQKAEAPAAAPAETK
ncbi:MAG: preprotein translocase subunit SecG [Bdellovibrionales bacterium]